MGKVDIIINIYGKPWQTLCALKSLIFYSGQHIDKIYVTEENHHPYNDSISWILKEFTNIIHYIPKYYSFMKGTSGNMMSAENRYTSRYQYGIENSDKEFVFIMHNDILFTGDIIGDMLSKIDNNAGIGLIGQCWNCPAFKASLCNGEKYDVYDPTYEEILEVMNTYPASRGTHHNVHIDKLKPMPLPECRLNEFACLINRNVTMKECFPNGDSPLFASYDILDLGDAWFRSLFLKGYKFKNYDINLTSEHGYFSKIESRNYETDKEFYVSGYPTQLNEQAYRKAELSAKEYYNTYLKF